MHDIRNPFDNLRSPLFNIGLIPRALWAEVVSSRVLVSNPFPSSLGGPRTQDPLRPAGLERFIATFVAISLLIFFASFFDVSLD